jgi:hypothetical protein
MKRLLLFLILITWFVYAIGIPAFIQKNKINLTPEQEAAYQRKVQKRPDEYTFNPMHVGDKWWYHDSDGHLDCGKTVVADTIINNIQMFKHSSFGSWERLWLYNEGDSVRSYDGLYDCDENLDTETLLFDDFSLSQPDQDFYTYWVWDYYQGMVDCSLVNVILCQVDYIPIFSDTVLVKTYRYDELDPGYSQWYISWAQKYGMCFSEIDFWSEGIVAARINGVMYGDSTAVSIDEEIPTTSESEFIAYPNPFETNTNISYNLAQKGIIHLEIYNLKGQKVKTLADEMKAQGKYTTIWNGTDDSGKAVSAGMYFCRLATSGKVFTAKLIHLK